MAAQALSFCSSFWGSSNSSSSSSPSLQHQQTQHLNPNTVTFQQRKRPRPSNSLSLSSSNPNCNFNSITPITLQPQNTNPFFNNTTFFPTDHLCATNPSFFDPPSPQTLLPLHQDHYYSYTNPFCDPAIPDFSSPEDQLLLAPFLAEPEPINALEFPVQLPQENHVVGVVGGGDVPLKKQCSGSGGGGGVNAGVSPQSIAARERRRRITERTAELGKLIPGGNKMSTAEMFQAAYKYVKFLKAQVSLLQLLASSNQDMKEEEQLHIKELEILASPIIQEKLYSEEKCLVPKQFLNRVLANHQEVRRN